MEAYNMGLMRNIPDAHPVYRPHMRYTTAINTTAREHSTGESLMICIDGARMVGLARGTSSPAGMRPDS